MKVTYIGTSDARAIAARDLIGVGLDAGLNTEDDDFVWSHNQTLDVPDTVGEYLTETYRGDFKSTDLINRDLRSKDELYTLAQKLQIPNRSTMNRDQLAEAVDAAIVDQANDSEGEETPQGVLEGLEDDAN